MGEIIRNGEKVRFEFEKSEILQFKDLKIGDKFIVMPVPGDDSGRGGFKETHWILQKTAEAKESIGSDGYKYFPENTIRLVGGNPISDVPEMWVIKIE